LKKLRRLIAYEAQDKASCPLKLAHCKGADMPSGGSRSMHD
jgi:hypothetical protein